MTDTMTFQDIDLSSWDTQYIYRLSVEDVDGSVVSYVHITCIVYWQATKRILSNFFVLSSINVIIAV